MVVNDTTIKKPLSMADMPKSEVKKALLSAKETRKKVRAKIKDGKLAEVPKEINDFLTGKVA